ncbi:hypothetical protein VaNZ11_013530 [Volvox africanus]|uniref:Uncharacterized protein n=1 Tax=Volvox africanus TaxID=51714 RepID=A0ABQ5SH71_9CHLO|nr:hypothetical protein VaNZ11_013530 [Volvox africanus]
MASNFDAHALGGRVPASRAQVMSTMAPGTAAHVVSSPPADVANSGESVIMALRHVAQQQALLAQQQLELTEAGRSEQRDFAAERQRLAQRAAELQRQAEDHDRKVAVDKEALVAREQALAARERALAAREEDHQRKVIADKEAQATREQNLERKVFADKEALASREQALAAREQALAARAAADNNALAERKQQLADAESQLQALSQKCSQEYMALLAVRAELQERLMAARLEAQAYIGGTGMGTAAGAGFGSRAVKHHQPGAAGHTSIAHDVVAAGTGSANGTSMRAWTETDVPAQTCATTDAKAAPAGVAGAVAEGEIIPNAIPIHSGSNDPVFEGRPPSKDTGRAAGGDAHGPPFRFAAERQPGKRVGAEDGGWRQEFGDAATDNGLRLGRSATESKRRPGSLRYLGQDKPRVERGPFSAAAGTSRVTQQRQVAASQSTSDGVLTVEQQQQQQPGGTGGAGAAQSALETERLAASGSTRIAVRPTTSEEAFDDRDEGEMDRCPREEEEEAAQVEAQRRMDKEKDQKIRWAWMQSQQQKPKLQKAHYQQAPALQKQVPPAATAQQLSLPRQSPPPQHLHSQHQGSSRDRDVQGKEKKRPKPDQREDDDVIVETIVETRKKRKGVDEGTKQQQDEEENSQRKIKRSKSRLLKRDQSEQGRDKKQDEDLQTPSVPVEQSNSPSPTPIASTADDEVVRAEAGRAANAAIANGGCNDRPIAAAAGGFTVQEGTSRAGGAGRPEPDTPQECATRVAEFERASTARGAGLASAEEERDAPLVPSVMGPPVQCGGSIAQVPSSASLKSEPGSMAHGTPSKPHHQSAVSILLSRAGSSDVEVVDIISPSFFRTAPTEHQSNHANRTQEGLSQQQASQQQDRPQSGPAGGSRLHPHSATTYTVQPDFPRSQGWSYGPIRSGVENFSTTAAVVGNNGPQSEPGGQAVPQPHVRLNAASVIETDRQEVEQSAASVRTIMPPPSVYISLVGQEAEVRTRKPTSRQESKGLKDTQDISGQSFGSIIAGDAGPPPPPHSSSDGTGSTKPPQQQQQEFQHQFHSHQHSAQPPRTHLVYPRNPPSRPSQRAILGDPAAANGTATTRLQEYGPVPPGPSHPHLQQQSGAQQGHAGKITGGRGVPGPFRRQRMKAAGRRGGDEGGIDPDLDGVLDEDFARTVDMLRQEQELQVYGCHIWGSTGCKLSHVLHHQRLSDTSGPREQEGQSIRWRRRHRGGGAGRQQHLTAEGGAAKPSKSR